MTEFPNKYYVNKDGKFLGQFSGYIVDDTDGKRMVYAMPDDIEAIEVEYPPEDGRQFYNFDRNQWNPL